jgi:hypothetical protein
MASPNQLAQDGGRLQAIWIKVDVGMVSLMDINWSFVFARIYIGLDSCWDSTWRN